MRPAFNIKEWLSNFFRVFVVVSRHLQRFSKYYSFCAWFNIINKETAYINSREMVEN
jgi:hypothetical protein